MDIKKLDSEWKLDVQRHRASAANDLANAEFIATHDGDSDTVRAALHETIALIRSLVTIIEEYRDAVRIDVLMEGPKFAGCNLSQLKRAWDADRARTALEGRKDG